MNASGPLPASPSLPEPSRDCGTCVRLTAFRADNRARHPAFYNAPVPSFGPANARLLVVGLAPGLKGANATGRPFTGDYAGDLLYPTLIRHGFATGSFERRSDDGLQLVDCRITNAVRCVPPENKPTTEEQRNCAPYLESEISGMGQLRAILALGAIAHSAVLKACGFRKSARKFVHGARHDLIEHVTLFDSYHCSRYNVNTGRLTESMFDAVVGAIREDLSASD